MRRDGPGRADGPIPVVAAVIERRGRFLVARRPSHKRHGGLWEFPGGKIQEGESDADAVSRELAEELDLRLETLGRLLHQARDPGSPFVIRFLRARVKGEPRPLEHDAVEWCTVEELAGLKLAPTDEGFVRAVLEPGLET